jgi:glyoxylase-like metal-dependent hydrolase (beta-lactamase superfamily II)
MRAIGFSLVLALAMGGGSLAQPASTPPAPMVRVEGLRPVSPHVQVIPDNSVPLVANIGFVVGEQGVLVVDTGLGPRNGAAVANVARRIAPGRTLYLVATHAHPEHDLGAQAFPVGSKLIRSNAQSAEREADLRLAQLFAGRSPAVAELLKDAAFRPADIGFATSYRLDLGGVVATVMAMDPAHTGGDTVVWVGGDKVLFSGDLAMQAQPAVVSPKASLASWRRDLDALAALGPAVVVPSHGPIGDAGFIRGYRDYLKEVGERTAQAKASGASLDAATEAVWQAMRARYPDRGRLAGAVRMAYAG